MENILDELVQISDVVIIDGPPTLVSDAAAISTKVDGVLMVIRNGFTRRTRAQTATEQLNRIGARVLGVVFNRMSPSSNEYYGKDLYFYQEQNTLIDNNGTSHRGLKFLKHQKSALNFKGGKTNLKE